VTPARRAFGDTFEPRLRAAAERLMAYDFKPWFYGDSVGFEGLVAASWLLDDRRYVDFVRAFLRSWAIRDEPPGPDDNTAPGRVLCELAGQADDDTLAGAAVRLARFLDQRRCIAGAPVTFEDASRSLRVPYGKGTLGDEDRALLVDPGAGIYVDCLHFDPPFLAALARLLGVADRMTQAVTAARGYVSLLQDPTTGLFHHFWLERRERAYGLGWGRGQGWALLGLLDVLERLPEGSAGCGELRDAVERSLEAMLGTQLADGSWPAVAGVPESGHEASTAAFMVIGFQRARRLGIGDAGLLAPAAERAWAATLAKLDESGLLRDVSAAVYSSTSDEHYRAVPLGFDVPWGQGPLLVAAAEMASSR
jgi:unsaturated rhamnogalacturonyl hydrolase